jgi:hypothetical protein
VQLQSLTKFFKSVDWNDEREVKEAVQLLPKWTSIDVDDALELLGPQFSHPAVRAYAVERLGKSNDDVRRTLFSFDYSTDQQKGTAPLSSSISTGAQV